MVGIFVRLRQPEEMIDRNDGQKRRGDQQHCPPGAGDVAGPLLEDAAEHHQQALAENQAAAVEGVADADE